MRTVGKTVAGKTVRVTAPKAAAEKAVAGDKAAAKPAAGGKKPAAKTAPKAAAVKAEG